MNDRYCAHRRWLTACYALLLADTLQGCHGGELVYGRRDDSAAAGRSGQPSVAGNAGRVARQSGGQAGTTLGSPVGGNTNQTDGGAGGFTTQVTNGFGSAGVTTTASSGTGAVPTNVAGAEAGVGGTIAKGGNRAIAGDGADRGGSGAIGNGGSPVAGSSGSAAGGAAGSAPEPTLITSAENSYFKVGTLTEVATETADMTVNDSSTAQIWEGFGGAFNEMGWDYLSRLSPADRDLAMNLLFGADGARFAFGRIPIGANDYAMDRYTDDETANDIELTQFSIGRDEQKLIPYIEAALAVKPDIRFWANPWTPPTWMKDGPFTSGNVPSPFDGGSMKNDDVILKAYAQYFVKFIEAYARHGITIEVVAPQNEPNYEETYPSCHWPTALFTKFIGQYLGPAFDTAGIGTLIMLGTMSTIDKDPALIAGVLGDAVARSYIKVIGLQWAMVSSISATKAYNLPVWQTEHRSGNYPWNPVGFPPYVSSAAPNDFAYGLETWGYIRDSIKAGVNSYNAWNMVLDKIGKGIDTGRDWAQNALLIADGGKLTPTPAYYVFRHFSQFVDPGARVIGASGADAVAFKNPNGTIVTVLYNSGSSRTMTVALGGKKLQFSMPGKGWATINWTN
jgi:glucosylceramidase